MTIHYKTTNISSDELEAACALVNQGGQLSITLTQERLKRVSFLVVAVLQNVVVGVSCIKKYDDVAEIGYTAVCAGHRRQKIGQEMTARIITHALKQDIVILCGIVFKSNFPNRGKLEKLGFFKSSEFISKSGDATLCWYCHPLSQTKSVATTMMERFLVERGENERDKKKAAQDLSVI